MEQLLIIFNSLLFLLVGYFLGRHPEKIKLIEKIPEPQKKTKITEIPVKSGIIEYPSQADIDYRESGQDKVDEAREKLFKENFKP